ncbi:MAG TPA: hypothetical protein VH678_06850 [Xanthobacteraceae bacterium]|jgi:hypothetical protein
MPEYPSKAVSAYRSLEKTLLLEALDLLEQEFIAFRQQSDPSHQATANTTRKLTLIDADVKRTQELLLILGT